MVTFETENSFLFCSFPVKDRMLKFLNLFYNSWPTLMTKLLLHWKTFARNELVEWRRIRKSSIKRRQSFVKHKSDSWICRRRSQTIRFWRWVIVCFLFISRFVIAVIVLLLKLFFCLSVCCLSQSKFYSSSNCTINIIVVDWLNPMTNWLPNLKFQIIFRWNFN